MMSESSNLVAGASSSVDSEVEVSAGEEQVVVVTLKQNKWVVTVMLALNLANSTLGAGVLGLPLVAKDSGLVAAILMLIGCALLTDWTLHLLLQCHLISQLNTYEAIGEFCFGRKGKWAVAVGVMLINFGAMIAYLVIAGDLVAPLIPVDSIRYGVIVLATAIAFPLSLVRGRVLAMVSAASVLLVIGFCFMVVVQAAEGPVHPEEPLVLVQWSTRLVFSFGIVSFAYSCHTNLVPLSAECHGQEHRLLGVSLHVAMMLCTSLYIVVSACGYSYLREGTIGNYLEYFPSSDIPIAVFRCVLAASLICTLPLCVMPCVGALVVISGKEFPTLFSLAFLVGAMLIAMFVPNVAVVFSLTGSVASSLTAFIFPPILFAHLSGISLRSLKGVPFVSCAVFGILLAILGIISTAFDIAKVNV